MKDKFEFIDEIFSFKLDECCPFFIAAAVLEPDFSGKRRIVSGRGFNPEEALETCRAEAAERWCAIFRTSYPRVWGTEKEMSPAALPPDSLLLISDRQYDNAETWNASVEDDHRLPGKRQADQATLWVESQSLTRNMAVLVPAAYCFLGYPGAREQGFPVPDSSGLAAGHDRASAITRGLLELIERDAVAIWWYGRIARPKIALGQGELPVLAAFETWIKSSGRHFWLLDLTHDLNIPVVAAVACNDRGRDLSFGFAAGGTIENAASAALGELTQFEATKWLSQRSAIKGTKNFIAWCAEAHVDEHPFLRPAASSKTQAMAVADEAMPAALIEMLEKKGLEVMILDLGRKDVPLAVVRVIVPGLRPIWPRFAPGRLYDVPTALGWRASALAEQNLNPIPILY
jgi:ribosomal protein S12 methylthiotransferase accessory factor